ncbi:TolC family protein [Roseateles sp. DC23W]|uniref:TolC family protein n=1 Tax=Pelomonas dachongensis TaxID=3299029 RepID=A0ABW7EL98_9BURK
MHKKLIALAVAALLAGCAHGPAERAPDIVPPAAWTLASGDVKPDWSGLLDATLADLQDRALTANRDIAQAAQRWQQARLLQQQGELRLVPSAGLNFSASRPVETQSSTRNVDIGGGVIVPVTTSTGWSRSYGSSVGLGYELDLWDRLAQSQVAQRAQTEIARTDIDAARLSIRSQVADAYWSLAALRAQRPLAEAQLALTRETLELTRARVREGKLLPIEIDKIALTVQAAENRLADNAADSVLQRHRLALLLAEPLPGPAPDAVLPAAAPPQWRLADPADVLARRPDVQRARLAVDAALAGLRAREAERYPRLSFSASLGAGGAQVRDWFANPALSLGANLAIPLIDWRRLALQRDGARSDLELAALSLRDALDKAQADIETQRIEAQRLAEQLAANAGRLREATENERLATLRYEVGTISRADWLQVKSARLDAEQGSIQLRLQQWQRQALLFKALGGA